MLQNSHRFLQHFLTYTDILPRNKCIKGTFINNNIKTTILELFHIGGIHGNPFHIVIAFPITDISHLVDNLLTDIDIYDILITSLVHLL